MGLGRIVYNGKYLSLEQVSKLDKLGLFGNRWNIFYELLKEYLGVYKRYPLKNEVYKGVRLGSWVSTQRNAFNNGEVLNDGSFRYGNTHLTVQRINMLCMIGFVWNYFDEVWERSFSLLKEYLSIYGEYPLQGVLYKGIKLGDWVHIQRLVYANGKLDADGSIVYKRNRITKEQVSKLNSINFKWFVREKCYEKRDIKTEGQMEGTRRFLLYKYRSFLELKRDVNEVASMIEYNMLSQYKK